MKAMDYYFPRTFSANLLAAEDAFSVFRASKFKKSLEWVTAKTQLTKDYVESYKDFDAFNREAYESLTTGEKILSVSVKGEYVYHLLQNKEYVKGLWRRQSLEAYKLNSKISDV